MWQRTSRFHKIWGISRSYLFIFYIFNRLVIYFEDFHTVHSWSQSLLFIPTKRTYYVKYIYLSDCPAHQDRVTTYQEEQGPLKISTPLWKQTGSSQDLYIITGPNRVRSNLSTITEPNRVFLRSLYHYATKQGPLKISILLRAQTGSSQDLYTITEPNRVLSRSLHDYGAQQGPLKICTPLRTQTESSQDLYTITGPSRFRSRSLYHYGPRVLSRSLHHYGSKHS